MPGIALYQVGEFATWERVARWLAGLHTYFAGERGVGPASRTRYIIDYDADFYRVWMRRARAFACRRVVHSVSRERCRAIARLAGRYERVVARLAGLPKTLIHGEFFPSNILVQPGVGGPRVCPVDWETVARGPGLIDLAALVAGDWTAAERRALALAYHDALSLGARWSDVEAFMAALDWCRLHLAVQWLGWSTDWTPPTEHAHDWLREALSLVEKLDL